MTISSSLSKIAFAGSGITGPFPIPWLFYANSDITVYTTVVATGVITTLVEGVGYNLTGAGNSGGGVGTATAVVPVGTTITFALQPPLTQLSDYVANEPFPSATLEQDLDREVQISQYLQNQITLAIKAPNSETAPSMTLPAAATRASQYLVFDGSGNVSVASGSGTDTALRTDLANTTTAGKGNELISYRRTNAEIAASVTPTDYSVPSHTATGCIYDTRYGAVEGADNIAALNKCNLVAAQLTSSKIVTLVDGLVTAPWVISAANVLIDGNGHYLKFSPTYAKDIGHDWSTYNQMIVVNADNVDVTGFRFTNNIVTATSVYFSGSFVWYAQGITGGECYGNFFDKMRYNPATNSVAVQVRTTSYNIKVHHNDFLDCCAGVSHQGLHGTVHSNTFKVTDAASGAALSASPGVWDQAVGLDGSYGCSAFDNKCYLSSGGPYSGAIIGANSTTSNFQIYANEIYGVRGSIAMYIRNSSNGKVFGNIIDGLGYTSVNTWSFLWVDIDSNNVDVTDNTLRGPLVAGVGTGFGLVCYTGGNSCKGNKVLMGTNSGPCLEIGKGTTPAASVFEYNYLQGGGVGTLFAISDNANASGIEQTIVHRHNTFADGITIPYNASGMNPNAEIWIENDVFTSKSLNMAGVTINAKLSRPFRVGLAHRFPHRVNKNIDIYSTEVPEAVSGNYQGATYRLGDKVHTSVPATATTPGVVCTVPGTIAYLTPYSQAGTAASGNPTITGLANTTNVYIGDYVSPSSKWATTGPYEVIAKTSTTLTLDTNANANGAATITHFAPVFKNEAVLS